MHRRGGRTTRGGAHQRVEGAGAAAGAHHADHVGGYMERPSRATPAASDDIADRWANNGRRGVRVLRVPVVGVAVADGGRTSDHDRVHWWCVHDV